MANQGGYQHIPSSFPPTEQPPPYFPEAPPPPTHKQSNVIVVQQQPQVVHHVTHSYSSDYGNGALIFAVFSSFCVFFFGSWWSLTCTIPAIFFALNANTAASTGNLDEAQSQRNLSFGCSTGGLVSTAILWIILIIIIATAG